MDIGEKELEAILCDLCELYKVEREKLSATKLNHCGDARVSCLPIAKKIFDPIPRDQVPAVYLALFDYLPKFVAAHSDELAVRDGYSRSSFSMDELLLNVIVPYQLPHSAKIMNSHLAEIAANKKTNTSSAQYPARVHLDIEHSVGLIRYFLPIKLPPETKLWKQIRYILEPSDNVDKVRLLGPEVANAYRKGTISFAALTFMMRDAVLSNFIEEPQVILHALYLGPLGAPTVEIFACGRSDDFRRRCRAVLNDAIEATKSLEDFEAMKPSNISAENTELCCYEDFYHYTQNLIGNLKGESCTDSTIPIGWARAALKKFARKTYIEKTWKEENLYELIWTIMSQRPTLKKYICTLLEKDFHDYGAARYWRCMQPAFMRRTNVRNRNEHCSDPLLPTENFLNFPADVKSIVFLRTSADLRILTGELNDLKNNSPVSQLIVGLDAEWSAYVARSRATILQLALRDRIFIIDLDNRAQLSARSLRDFFGILFLDKAIVKLGFQFCEDLTQLRAAIPHCRALFEPENVICVGKLVEELFDLTEKLDNGDAILNDVLPSSIVHSEVEQPEIVREEAAEGQGQESTLHRTVNRGLSYVCERVLGRPLDKTEQCSVWDRRPLRSSQLRYAAMDAYCLILIYDVCCRWAERLKVSIEEILSRQEPIRVSPPLLSEEF
ncbi:hypothetical protein KIN20_030201 [Parelaphostrongylus tenuis]|uniref:3'-5' exonuclease domain-containing protein n=1 Tax=Parelaphostrongylus tenuis TaxID=148309 RepID=A0AAD5WG67_PARTN|nr:hypothetical protein KIN20_030201 [Parelaphostrongylus tenuis]